MCSAVSQSVVQKIGTKRTQELTFTFYLNEIIFWTYIKSGSLIVVYDDQRKEEMILKVEPRPFRPTCYSYEETCPVLFLMQPMQHAVNVKECVPIIA